MTEQERWLAANTIKCERWRARITPTVCREYRQNNPERCKGCEGMAADPAKVVQWGSEERAIKAQQLEQPKRKDHAMNKPRRECAKCKEKKTITGRGLCSTCYRLEREAEALEPKSPASGISRQPVPETDAQPTVSPAQAEEELATAVLELLFPNGIAPRHLRLGLEVAKDVNNLLEKTWGMR